MLWPGDPAFQDEIEAVKAVTKFIVLQNLGSGYTFENLEDEEYKNLLYIVECTKWYNKKIELERGHADFYSKESMRHGR